MNAASSRTIETTIERFPIAGSFRIARGARTEAVVVRATIRDGDHFGTAECVPYARYGETPGSVVAQIAAMPSQALLSRDELQGALPAGAARNAVDCALWDLEAKAAGTALLDGASPLLTAYTLSIDTPEAMQSQAEKHASRGLLKVKVGIEGDRERMHAVREGAPDARIILDANEGWSADELEPMLALCAELRFDLVEQPVPAGEDEVLSRIERPVPVCADESVHARKGLEALRPRYDAVNIKLDKTGGLTEAFALREEARSLGFRIMVGCMLGSSLAMAPAILLAQDADFVDLDGPLLLARDREHGLRYEGDRVWPPEPALWG